MQQELRDRPDRTLSFKRVREMTDLSRTTVWRMQKLGQFPLPIQISPGRVGWIESEVLAWRATRIRGELPMVAVVASPPEPLSSSQPAELACEPSLEAPSTAPELPKRKPRRRPDLPPSQQLAFGF